MVDPHKMYPNSNFDALIAERDQLKAELERLKGELKAARTLDALLSDNGQILELEDALQSEKAKSAKYREALTAAKHIIHRNECAGDNHSYGCMEASKTLEEDE